MKSISLFIMMDLILDTCLARTELGMFEMSLMMWVQMNWGMCLKQKGKFCIGGEMGWVMNVWLNSGRMNNKHV